MQLHGDINIVRLVFFFICLYFILIMQVSVPTTHECLYCIVRLCPALKAVFEHGLKKSSLLGGPGHPWLFIEEV
jgi:hypothetical protein